MLWESKIATAKMSNIAVARSISWYYSAFLYLAPFQIPNSWLALIDISLALYNHGLESRQFQPMMNLEFGMEEGMKMF